MSPTPPEAAAEAAHRSPEAERLFGRIMLEVADSDPYPLYHRLRTQAPVLRTGDGMLVLTRYADCDGALRHRSLGKGGEVQGMRLKPIPEDKLRQYMARLERSMLFTNPPDHSRLRQAVSSAFSARHVEALRTTITTRVRDLLAKLAEEPGGNFMTEVGQALPIGVVADLIGIPESDRAEFIPKARELAGMVEPTIDDATLLGALNAESDLAAYFTELLDSKRKKPTDDLLGRLVSATNDDALDEIEMVSTALLLMGAGIESTSNLLGNLVNALLQHPDQLALLRADPGLSAGAVEETLRHDSPVQFDARTVLEPAHFAGADLEPGQTVTIMVAAANYDPAHFKDPDTFDITRTDNSHLSFAAGIHFCLGAHLARLEANAFLDEFLRYTHITATATPQRRAGIGLRGFSRIPLALSR